MSFEGNGSADSRILTYQGDSARFFNSYSARYTGANYLAFATTVAPLQWEGISSGNPAITSWTVDIGQGWGFQPYTVTGGSILGFYNTEKARRGKVTFECSGFCNLASTVVELCLDQGTTRQGTSIAIPEPFSQISQITPPAANQPFTLRVERVLDFPQYAGSASQAVLPYMGVSGGGFTFNMKFARLKIESF